MSRTRTNCRLANAAILAAGIFAGTSALAADFTIRYLDKPGKGFNDSTPMLPVPGNPGNTLGQQRRNVMNHAVSIWGAVLTSDVKIVVDASFSGNLECAPTRAVLGGATTSILLSNFDGAPEPDTWYPAALADALAGKDLCSEPGSSCAGEGDLVAVFNRKLDDDPECLNNARSWYYGLDHEPGGTGLDFLNVLLHELAHGLGFQTFTDELTGGYFRNQPTVFDRFVRDLSNQQTWVQMTVEQRAISAANTGNVIWDGEAVAAAASNLIAGKAGGGVVLHAPDPPRPGSSISHWDTVLTPNALMEPRLSADLRSSTNLDLTPCVLKDLGWELARGGSCAQDVPAYAEILVSSNALDLGRTVPGKATSFGVRVENPGRAPLQIGLRGESDGPDAPFSIASDTCSGKALEQDEGCVLAVLFAPTQTGTFDGKFVIPSNDPSNPALPITLTASADSVDSAAGGTGNEAPSAATGTVESGDSGGNDVGDAANPFADGPSASSGGGGTIGPAALVLLCATGILGRRRLRRTG